jgi:CheY-like chemotaxis protein
LVAVGWLQVVEAVEGREAANYLDAGMPALAMLDLKMPGLARLELLREFQDRLEERPVIGHVHGCSLGWRL